LTTIMLQRGFSNSINISRVSDFYIAVFYGSIVRCDYIIMFKCVERRYLRSDISSRDLIYMSGFLSEVIFYRCLLSHICPPPRSERGEHFLLIFPYKYNVFEQIRFGHDIFSKPLKNIGWKFLECVLRDLGLITNMKDVHRVLNQLLIGKIYSDFIPLLQRRSVTISPSLGGIKFELCSERPCQYNVFYWTNSIDDLINDLTIVDFVPYRTLFDIIINSRYRPDALCLYYREVSKKSMVLNLKNIFNAYGSSTYGKFKENIKTKIKVVEPQRALIVEVKSSAPTFSRSYTPNQRKFMKLLNSIKNEYKDMYKYVLVYIPLHELLNELWYEIYLDE